MGMILTSSCTIYKNLPGFANTEEEKEVEDVENLANSEKFKRKIPFQTRSGRTVKFSSNNQIKFIESYGKCKPVPKR